MTRRAQRLHVRCGYVPDGRGVAWRDQAVPENASFIIGNDLELGFVKALRRCSTLLGGADPPTPRMEST